MVTWNRFGLGNTLRGYPGSCNRYWYNDILKPPEAIRTPRTWCDTSNTQITFSCLSLQSYLQLYLRLLTLTQLLTTMRSGLTLFVTVAITLMATFVSGAPVWASPEVVAREAEPEPACHNNCMWHKHVLHKQRSHPAGHLTGASNWWFVFEIISKVLHDPFCIFHFQVIVDVFF